VEEIDSAFERFGAVPAASPTALTGPVVSEIKTERDLTAGNENEHVVGATETSGTDGDDLQPSEHVIWQPHVAWNWAALVAFGLAAGSQRGWDQEVDEALEQSEDQSWRRATKWLSKLRVKKPH
jgi:hypothetical protein